VLHDDHALDSVHLKPLVFPTPMFGLAITPKARGDEQKISGALAKLAEEDPTFKWTTDRQTHEVVINGLGELHLRLVLERFAKRGLHVDTKPPKDRLPRDDLMQRPTGTTATRNRPAAPASSAKCSCASSRWSAARDFEIRQRSLRRHHPRPVHPGVEKGVHDLMDQGAIAGYPLQDIRVAITDGKHHPVDSKEVAFRTAGKFAFKDAVMKARPVLLEPIVQHGNHRARGQDGRHHRRPLRQARPHPGHRHPRRRHGPDQSQCAPWPK
jgi:elongation factor G